MASLVYPIPLTNKACGIKCTFDSLIWILNIPSKLRKCINFAIKI